MQRPHRSYGHARARIGRVGGDRPEEDAWRHIGASAAPLNDPVTREDAVVGARAVEAARLAVMLDDANAYAHYQLGRALGRQRAYPLAAAAFEEAIAREPRFAYAHYYAGLSHYQAGRTDLMAVAFDSYSRARGNFNLPGVYATGSRFWTPGWSAY